MRIIHTLIVTIAAIMIVHQTTSAADGKTVDFFGYRDCPLLENERVRVILCPQAGGRVLEYSLDGVNAIYLDEKSAGWTMDNKSAGGGMTGGRFDIGPELTIPRHEVLWAGRWSAESLGPNRVRMTSQKDAGTGVQLERTFHLDPESTRLVCTQTIRNISDQPHAYCHWSRTFAIGGGRVFIPLTSPSRFPNRYVMYEDRHLVNMKPDDPNIRERDGFLEIVAAPRKPKLGMDTTAGWFGYLMPNDLLFIKQFPVDKDRVYNEAAGLTMSIWYPNAPMCELEPIGPRERLRPGEAASFTETWWLLPMDFPQADEPVDLRQLKQRVAAECR